MRLGRHLRIIISPRGHTSCQKHWSKFYPDSVSLQSFLQTRITWVKQANNDNGIAAWTRLMVRNNIGYHCWPCKKTGKQSAVVTMPTPENRAKIVSFTQSPGNTFNQIRRSRPNQEIVQQLMSEFLLNCRFEKCTKNQGYIKAMGVRK